MGVNLKLGEEILYFSRKRNNLRNMTIVIYGSGGKRVTLRSISNQRIRGGGKVKLSELMNDEYLNYKN